MSIKEWKIADLDREKAEQMSKKWKISFFLAVLLDVRKLTNRNEAHKFLHGYNNFSDPFSFVDMDKLKNRVEKAIKSREKICIYGDYDADGVTAAALVYSYMKKRGADVMYFIPRREGDGYGLSKNILDKLSKEGVKLVFTVDNGISAYEEVQYAKTLGIDCVITDHHRPPDIIPDASAVVNPYRKDCTSKFKCFSGVGVAFKAVCALEKGRSSLEELICEYADLVTIGTIGDFIELTGETRDIVRRGLKIISNTNRPGIRVILENMGIYKKQLDTSNIVFGIVPRINVSGRIDRADKSVELLLSDNTHDASEIFREINEKNHTRRNTELEIYKCIEQQLRDEPWRKYEKIIIVEGENWHQGVLGIVASRMVKKYGKPCILMTFDNENAKGSCRSVEGFSIHDAISSCSEYLERFGGHPMAAGINLKTENIGKFKKAILSYAESFGEFPFPCLNLDCKLNPAAISAGMIDQLVKLKPFGSGNPEPVFGIYSLRLETIRVIGGGKHLKLILRRGDVCIDAMYFGKPPSEFLYNPGEVLDLAASLHENTFLWSNGVSLYISDVKLSDSDQREALTGQRIYEKFRLGKPLTYDELKNLIPSRDDVACVYRYFGKYRGLLHRVDVIMARIKSPSLSSAKIYAALDIITELGIADVDIKCDCFTVKLKFTDEKRDMNKSPTFQRLNSLAALEEGSHD